MRLNDAMGQQGADSSRRRAVSPLGPFGLICVVATSSLSKFGDLGARQEPKTTTTMTARRIRKRQNAEKQTASLGFHKLLCATQFKSLHLMGLGEPKGIL